jgi:hypothetical protein
MKNFVPKHLKISLSFQLLEGLGEFDSSLQN